MISVNLTGRLTRDPELRALPSGGSVCSLRLAVEALGRHRGDRLRRRRLLRRRSRGRRPHRQQGLAGRDRRRLEHQQWDSDGDKRSRLVVVGHISRAGCSGG